VAYYSINCRGIPEGSSTSRGGDGNEPRTSTAIANAKRYFSEVRGGCFSATILEGPHFDFTENSRVNYLSGVGQLAFGFAAAVDFITSK
jgi:hypothetical protein